MRARTNTLRRLLGLLRPFWRGMALAVLLGALTIASSVYLMATSAWMISKAGVQPSIADLGVSVVAVRFFGIARAGFRYLERLASHDTTFRILARLRVRFYEAVEPLAPARLMQYRSGDLLGRVVGDIETLQDVFLRGVAPPVVAVLIALLLTSLLAAFDALAALVALGFVMVTGAALPLLAWWLGSRPGKALVAEREALHAGLVDALQGMADAVAYGSADRLRARLDASSMALAQAERRYHRLEGLQTALGLLLTHGAALAVLIVAIPRVDGILLATLTLATVAAFEAFTPLAIAANQFGASLEAADRVFALIDAEPVVVDPAQPAPLPERFDLRINDLTFRYAPDQAPVIDGLTLDIPYGQHVALTGRSGSGKSTLVNVLLRFWPVEAGRITIGGVDLTALAQSDARQVFGVMTQRTHLFNTTLRENIRIARPDATDAEVEAAARQAHIHAFISGLPDGYETYAGENGIRLSGGERQRVALARVLLKDAPVLILDEATAHLDSATERALLTTVLDAAQGRTVILLTHSRALLDRMDAIYTLEAP
jgi:ATP-binding cassette subfamily C protein CydC